MLANEDPSYQDLSKEQIQSLKDALQEHRDVMKMGARPSNNSAQQDVRITAARIGADVSPLLLPPHDSLLTASLRFLPLANAREVMASASSLAAMLMIPWILRGVAPLWQKISFAKYLTLMPGTLQESSSSLPAISLKVSSYIHAS